MENFTFRAHGGLVACVWRKIDATHIPSARFLRDGKFRPPPMMKTETRILVKTAKTFDEKFTTNTGTGSGQRHSWSIKKSIYNWMQTRRELEDALYTVTRPIKVEAKRFAQSDIKTTATKAFTEPRHEFKSTASLELFISCWLHVFKLGFAKKQKHKPNPQSKNTPWRSMQTVFARLWNLNHFRKKKSDFNYDLLCLVGDLRLLA